MFKLFFFRLSKQIANKFFTFRKSFSGFAGESQEKSFSDKDRHLTKKISLVHSLFVLKMGYSAYFVSHLSGWYIQSHISFKLQGCGKSRQDWVL